MDENKLPETVRCPFYTRNNAKEIYCEGAINGALTISRFKRAEKRLEYQESKCKSDYLACPIYCAINDKYEVG